tara:strand:- start:7643 stop:8272 length:630 start_codon:yes stop_codon:yes gene_type:complete
MKIAILIQARYNSKRLPGKVCLKVLNKELLLHVYDNCKKSCLKGVYIVTSKNKSDKPIVDLCTKNKIKYFKGNLTNVYLRYFQVIKKLNLDGFVRITGDSPLIDYKIINKAIKKFLKEKPDIITNVFPRSFPVGQSVEVINSKIFMNNYKNIFKKDEKEHITKYFYKNYKNFKIINFRNKKNESKKNLSINTKEDFFKITKMIKLNEKI